METPAQMQYGSDPDDLQFSSVSWVSVSALWGLYLIAICSLFIYVYMFMGSISKVRENVSKEQSMKYPLDSDIQMRPSNSKSQIQVSVSQFQERMKRIQAYSRNGNYQQILDEISLLDSDADTPQEKALTSYYRGYALYKLKRIDDALPYLLVSIQQDGKLASPYVVLSQIEGERGNTTTALDHAKKCASLDEKNPWCHNVLGIAYSVSGKKDLAIAEFKRAIELAPDISAFMQNLKTTMEQ